MIEKVPISAQARSPELSRGTLPTIVRAESDSGTDTERFPRLLNHLHTPNTRSTSNLVDNSN
eukprot:6757809-Alexandrium_andersonii.AAC.1